MPADPRYLTTHARFVQPEERAEGLIRAEDDRIKRFKQKLESKMVAMDFGKDERDNPNLQGEFTESCHDELGEILAEAGKTEAARVRAKAASS